MVSRSCLRKESTFRTRDCSDTKRANPWMRSTSSTVPSTSFVFPRDIMDWSPKIPSRSYCPKVKSEKLSRKYCEFTQNRTKGNVMRYLLFCFGWIRSIFKPFLIVSGVHVTNSNVFSFDGLQLINQPYINHGTLHILRIPKGMVALVTDNNKPKLLEGNHLASPHIYRHALHQFEDLHVLQDGELDTTCDQARNHHSIYRKKGRSWTCLG